MASNVLDKLKMIYGKDCGAVKGTDLYYAKIQDEYKFIYAMRIFDFDGEVLVNEMSSLESVETDELGNSFIMANDRNYSWVIPIIKGVRKKKEVIYNKSTDKFAMKMADNYSKLFIQLANSPYGTITPGKQRLITCTGVPLSREASLIFPIAYCHSFLAVENEGITHIINPTSKSILKLTKPIGIIPKTAYILSSDIIYVTNGVDSVLLNLKGDLMLALPGHRIGEQISELDSYTLVTPDKVTAGFISKKGVVTPMGQAIKAQSQHKYNPKLREAVLEIEGEQIKVLLTSSNRIHQFVDKR